MRSAMKSLRSIALFILFLASSSSLSAQRVTIKAASPGDVVVAMQKRLGGGSAQRTGGARTLPLRPQPDVCERQHDPAGRGAAAALARTAPLLGNLFHGGQSLRDAV